MNYEKILGEDLKQGDLILNYYFNKMCPMLLLTTTSPGWKGKTYWIVNSNELLWKVVIANKPINIISVQLTQYYKTIKA